MGTFQYNIRASDADLLAAQTADVLDMKDRQLELLIDDAFTTDRVRYGTVVIQLPNVGTSATITYDRPFPSYFKDWVIIVTNGDYAANSARLEVRRETANTPTGFEITHGRSTTDTGTSDVSYNTGTPGGNVRVNYISIAVA